MYLNEAGRDQVGFLLLIFDYFISWCFCAFLSKGSSKTPKTSFFGGVHVKNFQQKNSNIMAVVFSYFYFFFFLFEKCSIKDGPSQEIFY